MSARYFKTPKVVQIDSSGKEWVRKYEEQNNQKLFDDTKYCPKCKIKTKHINRMCQVCFKINNPK